MDRLSYFWSECHIFGTIVVTLKIKKWIDCRFFASFDVPVPKVIKTGGTQSIHQRVRYSRKLKPHCVQTDFPGIFTPCCYWGSPPPDSPAFDAQEPHGSGNLK